MTKRILIAAGLVAALAGGSVIAIAQSPQATPGVQAGAAEGGGPGRGLRRGGPGGDLELRGVDLTDAQRQQVRSIIESHKDETQEVRTKLREAHRAFAEAVRAETVNEADIRARSTAVATAMADEAILHAKVRAEVHGILTTEQLQQLKDRGVGAEKHLQQRQQQRPRRQGPGRGPK